MSWQLATLLGLAIVLLAGFAWYERSRPSSRIVALVAALAALAVAGRLALAPLPNVSPTTDIVLIAGYSIGAAPGFAVGAIAALVSNFWLGQGPWTPWQMAGWGMCGLLGAWLALISGRRLGRLGLAIACGLAGLLYGALLDLSTMVTYGGEQSLERYLAFAARGLPFNIAHAVGNFAIALAIAPALVRMLVRFRERAEVRWQPPRPAPAGGLGPGESARLGAGAAAVLAALCAILAVTAWAPPADSAAGRSGAAWLERAQNRDGGFGVAPGEPSDPAMTGWAALGLAAAGRNPRDVSRGGGSAIAYLRRHPGRIRTLGDVQRTILVLEAAGLRSRGFGGRNLVAELRRRRRADGSFQGQVNLTAFGILALDAARARGGVGRPAAWLRGAQNEDGGWGFAPGAGSDADSTGAAMQALAAAGGSGAALRDAVAHLRRTQRPKGGFALAGGPVNSQSTAWAVQGLIAAGVNPGRVRARGRSPLDYLRARRAPDGHYRYSGASDQTPVWVTAQVLLAVNRKAFPLAAVPRAPRRQWPQGGGGSPDGLGKGAGRKPSGGVSRAERSAPPARLGRVSPPGASSPPPRTAATEPTRTVRPVAAVAGGGLALWVALAIIGGAGLLLVGLRQLHAVRPPDGRS